MYPVYTVSVHWLYTAVSSVLPVYTLSNSVSSYTGATLDPLQCMHSVHCTVCPVYTLTDSGIGSGLVKIGPVFVSLLLFYILGKRANGLSKIKAVRIPDLF